MDVVLHVAGWLLFGVLLYATIQAYLGRRETKTLMAQQGWSEKDLPITLKNNPPGGGPTQAVVVSSLAQYWRVMAVELVLASLLLWFLTR